MHFNLKNTFKTKLSAVRYAKARKKSTGKKYRVRRIPAGLRNMEDFKKRGVKYHVQAR